jgi:hypothetical protein
MCASHEIQIWLILATYISKAPQAGYLTRCFEGTWRLLLATLHGLSAMRHHFVGYRVSSASLHSLILLLRSCRHLTVEVGDTMLLRNVGTDLHVQTALQPRRLPRTSSSSLEPQISYHLKRNLPSQPL